MMNYLILTSWYLSTDPKDQNLKFMKTEKILM